MVTNEELNFLKQQEEEVKLAQSNRYLNDLNQTQQAVSIQKQEESMIKDQLNLTEELEMIENLLRGNVLKKDEDGNTFWTSPENNEMIVLSEYGIHLIMNTITFYINKNTLLSNYEEDTINKKMLDFSNDLTDTVFMEYEKVFQYPSLEDCKKVLNERLYRKKELKKFTNEMSGIKSDDKEIILEINKELEGRIENEIVKIKEQIIKNKLKRFLILIREVQDAVHSTYLRAWKGQERTTLRQHIHITESRGNILSQPSQPSKLNPLNWLRGK